MNKDIAYIDEALKFLTTHSFKESSFVKQPPLENMQDKSSPFGPGSAKGGHMLSSGIKIHSNSFASSQKAPVSKKAAKR